MKRRPVGISILAGITLLSAVFKLIGLGILFSDDEMNIEASMIGVSIFFIMLRVVIAVGFLKGWSWTHILASIGFCITGYQRLTAVGKSDEPQIVSYYTGRPTRDLLIAARQEETRALWPRLSSDFDTYISALVLEESAA